MPLNGGELDGIRILSRKTVEIMTANTIGDLAINSQNYKFGFGFSVRTDLGNGELGSVGEYGWGGYWNTRFLINPYTI
jgi:CubicO group peptidase (beta-lactamase class C family)